MVIIEKSFPRGGTIASKDTTATKPDKHVFGAIQKKFKRNKTKSFSNKLSEDENLKSHSAELLSYDTIQDGMNIMGIIISVDQLYLGVSLPGRIFARISALEVSDAYTKSMKEFLQNSPQCDLYKPLKDLYSIGRIVYGRIKEIKRGDRGQVQVDMTLKPSEVHVDLLHSNIKRGFIFCGAVEEVQEHGYIIESGIKGLRCFVPLENSTAGHVLGELIYLKVNKITPDKSVSTCICKEVQPDKLKIKDQNDLNLDYLLPSTIVNFQVTEILNNGLQGSIMNEQFTAYVNEHQLSEPLILPKDYEINLKYEARILYIMPLTKFVYLTLNLRNKKATEEGEEDSQATELKRGDIVDAKVHHLGTGGVVLILKKKYKGIISFKTIKINYKGNYDQDELLAKYAQKSKHTVRIVDYDVIDSLYICTDDVTDINEKYFCLDDIKPGDFVTATVKEFNNKVDGYSLKLGKVNGIIEKLFLAPSIKTLESNTILKCRVSDVNVERKLVYLTNRSEYMKKNCKLLINLKEAKVNNNYTGTIVKCNSSFALVKFFGDNKGVLYKGNFLPGQLENMEVGRTMQFRISSIKGNQLILGLAENAFKMGEICPVSVVNTLDSGLEIKVSYSCENDEDVEHKGIIPVRLLSDYIDLLRAKHYLFSIGEQLQAVSISNGIFSLRDLKYFTEHLTCDWSSLKIGDILKSYIKDVNRDVIEIVVPIKDYTKTVKVHFKMMLMNVFNDDNIQLSPDQVIYVKVLGKENSTRTITVSAKLTDVWDGKMSSTAAYLESYLTEVSDIRKLLKKQGHAIARYSPGDKVTAKYQCVNDATFDWEYVLDETEVLGIVKASIVGKSKPPEKGTAQECVILWVDYSNMLVILSNRTGDLDHITTDKEISTNYIGKSGINAKILFKNESVFVCSLKKGKNPLVFCPTRLHFNDFEYIASKAVAEGQFCKLAFIHDSKYIAVLDDTHKLWQEINKKRKSPKEEKEDVVSKKLKLEEMEIKKNESQTEKKKSEKPKVDRKRSVSEIKAVDSAPEFEKPNKFLPKKTKIKDEDDISNGFNIENKQFEDDIGSGCNIVKKQEDDISSKVNKKIALPKEGKEDVVSKKPKLEEMEIQKNESQTEKKKSETPKLNRKHSVSEIKAVISASESEKPKKVLPKKTKTKVEDDTSRKFNIEHKQDKGDKSSKCNIKKEQEEDEISSECNIKNKQNKDDINDKCNIKSKQDENKTASECNIENKQGSIQFYEDKSPYKKADAKFVEISTAQNDKNVSSVEGKATVAKSLAGVSDFWNTDLTDIFKVVESSDEDQDGVESDDKAVIKKKQTTIEKFKQQREEEARLRAIEEKYADPNQLPDSIDQFDRLVLSDPNNSKHWINYMVFHLQSTEIDKARTVARRALKTITFRNSDEQINIWVALLNLELRYGSKETFNDTLKEALIYNDPIKVYLRTVEIITDAQKTVELNEIIGHVIKKYKTEPEIWRVCANAFFTVGFTEKAQQLLHKALACLPERDHVNTIVMFANLNHRHGNSEMAQTLLDQVVTSYPKRVDVWCQYVDMLVKADLIDSARNILERAVVQKIPLRKMRTIFKKYLEFEERFGNDTNVQRVKQLAMDFVKKSEIL